MPDAAARYPHLRTTHRKVLRFIDNPPFVALWRIGAVVLVITALWTWWFA